MLRGEIAWARGRVPYAVLATCATIAWLASTPSEALSTAHARAGAVPVPALGTTVTAGDTVRLSWPTLPADADEFELLLSLDGGRSYPVRLTPELAPGTTVLLWTVPNLPAEAARIRLRVGLDGDEVEGDPSPAFRLLPRPDRPPTPLWFEDGEWWASVGASLRPVELVHRTETVGEAAEPTVVERDAVASTTESLPPPAVNTSPAAVHPGRPRSAPDPAAPPSTRKPRPQRE